MKNIRVGEKANITYLKTIMMLSVVLFHSCVFYSGNWFTIAQPVNNAPYIAVFADFLNTFQTQAFTMASGYLFFCLKSEKGNYQNAKKDISKRFFRLIVPYFIICVFWAIPFHVYFYGFDIRDIVSKYLLGTSPDQLWFLLMLFWNFCLFYYIANKIAFNKKFLALFVVISMFGAILSATGVVSLFQIDTTIRYTVFYYLGGYIYDKENSIRVKICQIKYFLLYGLTGLILWLIWEMTGDIDTLIIKVFHSAEKSVASVFLVLFFYELISFLSNKISRILGHNSFFKKITSDSFGIYLFHQQIIYFVIHGLNGIVHPIFVVLASFICSLLLSDCIVTILKRTPIYKFLGI